MTVYFNDINKNFNISVEGTNSRSQVTDILKKNGIKFETLHEKRTISDKNITITISPKTEKDYLDSVDQLVQVEQGFFDRFVDQFKAFFHWLFQIEKLPTIQDSEVAFAMHLFRNEDRTVFNKLTGKKELTLSLDLLKGDLPLEETLKIWGDFFQTSLPYLPKQDQETVYKLIEALQQIESSRQELEKIDWMLDPEKREKALHDYSKNRQGFYLNPENRSIIIHGKDEIELDKSRRSSEKLMELFLKRVVEDHDSYRRRKNLLKAASFFALYQQMGKHLEDPDVRGWMRDNGIALLKSYEKAPKRPIGGSKEDSAYIQQRLKKIIEELNQPLLMTLPKNREAECSFEKKLEIPTQAAFSDFQITKTDVKIVDPLANFEKGVTRIQELIAKGDFKNAELLLEDTSRLLEKLDLTGLDQKGAEILSGKIRDFGLMAVQVNLGRGRNVPSPPIIHYVLQSLALTDALCRRFNDAFKGYQFDLDPIRKVLQDPYLSLGETSRKIAADLESLEKGKSLIRLTDPSDPSSNEQRFFESISKQDPEALYADIGDKGLLPSQIVHMRQLYLIMQCMLAPSRTLLPTGFGNVSGYGMGFGLTTVKVAMTEGFDYFDFGPIEQQFFTKVTSENMQKMAHSRGPITFTTAIDWNETFLGVYQFVIQPWGLAMEDLKENAAFTTAVRRHHYQHPQLYRENGISVDDETAQKRLFEQSVGKQAARVVDDTGKDIHFIGERMHEFGGGFIAYESHPSHYKHIASRGRTQLGILQEKLTLHGIPSDVIQELQLMETGPETRIQETVGKLAKHIGLLNEGPLAGPLQRLFERNFFRNNLLIEKLKKDPSYATTLVANLKEIAQGQKDSHQYRSYCFVLDLAAQIEKCLPPGKDQKNLHKWLQDQDLNILKQKADQGIAPYALYQREFHFYSLLLQARQEKLEDSISIVASQMILNNSLPVVEADPDKVQTIDYFLHQIRPHIKQAINANPDLCNQLVPNWNQPWKAKGKSGFLFTSGPYMLDLKEGLLWKDGTRTCKLPGHVLKALDFILKDENPTVQQKPLTKGDIEGARYDFTHNQTPYRVIFTEDNQLYLYKKIGSHWYQHQKELIQEDSSQFPKILTQHTCWIRDDEKELLAEHEGEVLYRGVLSGGEIKSLHEEKTKKQLLNPWEKKEFALLQAIEDPSQITATGSKDKVEEISYNRLNLTYQWKNSQWISPEHPKHFLSDGHPELFGTEFQNYHYLDSESELPKVILPIAPFKKAPSLLADIALQKNSNRKVPNFQEVGGHLLYTLHPTKGLVAAQVPEGYLYLAYILFNQGKDEEAKYYLEKGELNRPLSPISSQITQWLQIENKEEPINLPEEIISLQKQLKANDAKPPPPLPPKTAPKQLIPLFNLDIEPYFQPLPSPKKTSPEPEIKYQDPYAQEIASELDQDLQIYRESPANPNRTCTDPEGLLEALEKTTAKTKKAELFALLPPPPKPKGEWKELLSLIKEQNLTWQEALFDTVLKCFGEKEWGPLADLEGFNQPALEQACRAYLKEAIRMQQLQLAKEAILDLLGGAEPETKSKEIYDLLTAGWAYTDQDPDSPTLLLLEYELELVCRKQQIDTARSSLHNDNQFKQEICGGGKTSVLRNIVSHYRADGKRLSTISTLEPLRKPHGALLAKTTLHAFFEKTYEFKFSRKSPSDTTSLRKIQRNLLKTIVEKGRLDLTKGDLQSFKLEKTLKQEKLLTLDPKSPQVRVLNEELDIMEENFDLLKTRASVYVDELDKDCDSTQEKNYAHGDPIPLDADQIDGALDLMQIGFAAPPHSPAYAWTMAHLNNRQSKLKEWQVNDARMHLASQLFTQYKDQLKLKDEDLQAWVGYFTENGQTDSTKFFNAHIASHPKLCFIHEFLASIIPHASSKKGGVSYGRSEDQIHVIPFEGSDKPKEGSQHSLDAEQIWYTLIDYMDKTRGGLTADQVRQVVQTAKKNSQQELKKNRQLRFEETPTAIKFRKSFGLSLENVDEKDLKTIANTLNNNQPALFDYLKAWVFPEYQKSSHKLISDSQDPASMVHSYGGSSGTDLSKHALPASIDISNVRQPGAHGQIRQSLIEIDQRLGQKSFCSYQDFIKEMKGGDCLSDVAVIFPGVPAEAIAKKLSLAHPALTIRYMNRHDEWKMMKNGRAIPFNPNIPLNQVFTLFDDTHTRGVERPSMRGVTEYVTIDENTSWSKFEQGVLRERGVTQGKADVRYILSPSLLQAKPTLQKLETLLIQNEAKALKPLNLKTEKKRILAINRHAIEDANRAIRKTGNPTYHQARALIYEQTQAFYKRPQKADPRQSGMPFSTKEGSVVLEELAADEERRLKDLISAISSLKADPEVKFFLDRFTKQLIPALEALQVKQAFHHSNQFSQFIPTTESTRASELDNEQAVETETETEMEVQQEVHAEVEETKSKDEWRHRPLNLGSIKQVLDKLNYSEFHQLSPYMPKYKSFTANFHGDSRHTLPWTIGQIPPHQNRISRTLFVVGNGFAGELITSLKDNDEIGVWMRDVQKQGYLLSMYNYDTDCVDAGDRWDHLTQDQVRQVNLQIVSTKFQNGDVSFTQPQQKSLIEWLTSCNQLDDMERTFKRFIHQYRPSNTYQGSDMQKAFQEARKRQV